MSHVSFTLMHYSHQSKRYAEIMLSVNVEFVFIATVIVVHTPLFPVLRRTAWVCLCVPRSYRSLSASFTSSSTSCSQAAWRFSLTLCMKPLYRWIPSRVLLVVVLFLPDSIRLQWLLLNYDYSSELRKWARLCHVIHSDIISVFVSLLGTENMGILRSYCLLFPVWVVGFLWTF